MLPFGLSPLEAILGSFNSSVVYHKAPEMKDEELINEASLRDAIIYLEKKAEEMEEWLAIMNVYGKTRTEINEAIERHNKKIAPYRKAIQILKNAK